MYMPLVALIFPDTQKLSNVVAVLVEAKLADVISMQLPVPLNCNKLVLPQPLTVNPLIAILRVVV